MSDPIAEAAANLSDAAPSSTEPQGNADTGTSGSTGPVVSSSAPLTNSDANADMSGSQAIGAEVGEQAPVTGNVLVNAAPVVDAPAVAQAGEQPSSPSSGEAGSDEAELPRESHLMLLEAKFANALAKLRNAERVSVDELEAIYVHIKAVI